MATKTLWAYRLPLYGTIRIYEFGDGTKPSALDGLYGSMDYTVWRAFGGPSLRDGRVKMVRVDLTEVRSDD